MLQDCQHVLCDALLRNHAHERLEQEVQPSTGGTACSLTPSQITQQLKLMFVSKCDDLLSLIRRKRYSSHGAYAQSKLALVLFTYYLQEQMTAGGFPVTVNAVDPGMVDTALYDNLWSLAQAAKKPVAKILFRVTFIHLKYLLVLAFNLHYQPHPVASNLHFCCH